MPKEDPFLVLVNTQLSDMDKKLDEQNDELIDIKSKVKIMWGILCFVGVAILGFVLERFLDVTFN